MGWSNTTNEGKLRHVTCVHFNNSIEFVANFDRYFHYHVQNEHEPPPEDDEQPLVCMICEDKATGLHYGIITCEGYDDH